MLKYFCSLTLLIVRLVLLFSFRFSSKSLFKLSFGTSFNFLITFFIYFLKIKTGNIKKRIIKKRKRKRKKILFELKVEEIISSYIFLQLSHVSEELYLLFKFFAILICLSSGQGKFLQYSVCLCSAKNVIREYTPLSELP